MKLSQNLKDNEVCGYLLSGVTERSKVEVLVTTSGESPDCRRDLTLFKGHRSSPLLHPPG